MAEQAKKNIQTNAIKTTTMDRHHDILGQRHGLKVEDELKDKQTDRQTDNQTNKQTLLQMQRNNHYMETNTNKHLFLASQHN